MLYIENAGPDPKVFEGSNFTTVAPGEVAHHKPRRFVVVKEMSNQHFCYCWSVCLRCFRYLLANFSFSPITTYGGRATMKPGVDQTAHTIVYTDKTAPAKLEGEERMTKEPIRIVLASPDEKLDPLSRIDLSKYQVIQHNWRIRKIGDVHPKSLPKLLNYWKAVRDS